MLNGIPKVLSPDLLKILMEMGHGDEIVIADSNFPAASHAQRLIRCDGHEIPALLEAILQLMPLDQYVDKPAALMQVVPGDTVATPVWDVYGSIIQERASLESPFEMVERFAFYERARNAYAIIATSETERYANLILKKGCVL
ncbi:RbsD/FucU family protein [Paenibacillus sp. OV219]|uniref:RbsD/FucU family protein n=1 Tax=Paenibacillus sp. OV219 TaxID=1884377 RepID=UPI0008C47E24|nr:RbsD/FucU domain-containing protein [Paenibacillus sp. OV219]SEM64653.1 L-fucose mutarotase [Paenibacillus sp. OV219]